MLEVSDLVQFTGVAWEGFNILFSVDLGLLNTTLVCCLRFGLGIFKRFFKLSDLLLQELDLFLLLEVGVIFQSANVVLDIQIVFSFVISESNVVDSILAILSLNFCKVSSVTHA